MATFVGGHAPCANGLGANFTEIAKYFWKTVKISLDSLNI